MRSSRTKLLTRLRKIYPETGEQELRSAILCGEVRVAGETIRDARALIAEDARIVLEKPRYVSRGGLKLEAALDAWNISPEGLVCLDAGSSTGGFTDCLLSRGARLVHAVDVGYNQLAWKLRSHPRVNLRERTNIMDVSPGDLHPPPSLATVDLSFRSLRGAAERILEFVKGGTAVALVKPQFEGVHGRNFDGVVRSSDQLKKTVLRLRDDLAAEGVYVHKAMPSPLRGRRGNKEFFFLLRSVMPEDAASPFSEELWED